MDSRRQTPPSCRKSATFSPAPHPRPDPAPPRAAVVAASLPRPVFLPAGQLRCLPSSAGPWATLSPGTPRGVLLIRSSPPTLAPGVSSPPSLPAGNCSCLHPACGQCWAWHGARLCPSPLQLNPCPRLAQQNIPQCLAGGGIHAEVSQSVSQQILTQLSERSQPCPQGHGWTGGQREQGRRPGLC